MSVLATLLDCNVFLVPAVQFEKGSVRPTSVPAWGEMVERLTKVFRVAERRLQLTSYPLPDDAPTRSSAKRLAQRRGEWAHHELVARGLDPTRIVVAIGESKESGLGVLRSGQVRFEVSPRYPQREDFDPSDPNYAELCVVKYGAGTPHAGAL